MYVAGFDLLCTIHRHRFLSVCIHDVVLVPDQLWMESVGSGYVAVHMLASPHISTCICQMFSELAKKSCNGKQCQYKEAVRELYNHR